MENEINRCLQVLQDGGVILYPTDTIWGVGCDATNFTAVEKVYFLKRRVESKSMIVLLDDEKKIADYVVQIPEIAWDLLNNVTTPLTIIYPEAKNLAGNLVAEDGSIAIRIVKSGFCHQLLKAFGKPLVSSSANISGETAPISFSKITDEIKDGVDHVVESKPDEIRTSKASQIIKLDLNGEFRIIRK
jgi:L-threonylcarbamoyladenylate synthase